MITTYSVKEAAEKLGISDRRVRVLLNEGRLEGRKLGHEWVIFSLDYKRKRKVKSKKVD
ncbi:helix-turn-helix domain-containing protein [Chloroflexota bacterium]